MLLLNALMDPETQRHVASAYFNRAPTAAAIFLYGVGIIAIIAFVGAALSSMRVAPDSKK